MFGGSQRLSNILLVQKCLLWKLGLGGDNYRGKFNKLNIFVQASTFSACAGKSSKQGA